MPRTPKELRKSAGTPYLKGHEQRANKELEARTNLENEPRENPEKRHLQPLKLHTAYTEKGAHTKTGALFLLAKTLNIGIPEIICQAFSICCC